MTQLPDHYDDVGPGWRPLLSALHGELLTVYPEYDVAQVKEKFGGLRVYLEHVPDTNITKTLNLDDVIARYGRMSLSVCEYCGQYGTLDTTHHWVKVRCAECKRKDVRGRPV